MDLVGVQLKSAQSETLRKFAQLGCDEAKRRKARELYLHGLPVEQKIRQSQGTYLILHRTEYRILNALLDLAVEAATSDDPSFEESEEAGLLKAVRLRIGQSLRKGKPSPASLPGVSI